jgi:hypothetical protein
MRSASWISFLERRNIQVLGKPWYADFALGFLMELKLDFSDKITSDSFPFEEPHEQSHKEPDLCVIPHESRLNDSFLVALCCLSIFFNKKFNKLRIW